MIDYEAYEEYDIETHTRSGRRQRHRRSNPKLARVEIIAELVEQDDPQSAGFVPSYKAAYLGHHEQRWITSALGVFYEDWVITDVLRLVKGGKEAAVYCCKAHPTTGLDLIAAKIYRPRMFRSLKNDAAYREGRVSLSDEGKVIRDRRSRLAMQKKTRYGLELHIGSWIEHEYQALCLLYDAGVDVPEPIAHQGNVILMGYVGSELVPAPMLQRVSLRRDEAQALFERVMWNVEQMLAHSLVHADLSAYNILYWDGEIVLIDYPQAVNSLSNCHSEFFLARDIKRVCQYFARQGVEVDAEELSRDLWGRYMRGELHPYGKR